MERSSFLYLNLGNLKKNRYKKIYKVLLILLIIKIHNKLVKDLFRYKEINNAQAKTIQLPHRRFTKQRKTEYNLL